jgi:DNA primase
MADRNQLGRDLFEKVSDGRGVKITLPLHVQHAKHELSHAACMHHMVIKQCERHKHNVAQ